MRASLVAYMLDNRRMHTKCAEKRHKKMSGMEKLFKEALSEQHTDSRAQTRHFTRDFKAQYAEQKRFNHAAGLTAVKTYTISLSLSLARARARSLSLSLSRSLARSLARSLFFFLARSLARSLSLSSPPNPPRRPYPLIMSSRASVRQIQ